MNEKLSSLEEKYISNSISQATYEKWYPVYSKEVNKKKIELSELQKDGGQQLGLYDKITPYLGDLGFIYNEADVGQKQTFLKGIFVGGFTKEEVGGRTVYLNSMFVPNALEIGHLLRVDKIEKPDFSSGFPTCTPSRGRTGKSAKTTVFETVASTNSAIGASETLGFRGRQM